MPAVTPIPEPFARPSGAARALALLLCCAFAATVTVSDVAQARPELLSARFQERPVAGQAAVLELEFRDPDPLLGPVDDVHVDWGDNTVFWVVPVRPSPFSGPAPVQRMRLEHAYAERGAFGLYIELGSKGVMTSSATPVYVGPCAAPTATPSIQPRVRAGAPETLRVDLEDLDGRLGAAVIDWGDGHATTLPEPGSAARHRDLALRHRYARPGRYRPTVEVASVDNPPDCPGGTHQRTKRKLSVSVLAPGARRKR